MQEDNSKQYIFQLKSVHHWFSEFFFGHILMTNLITENNSLKIFRFIHNL